LRIFRADTGLLIFHEFSGPLGLKGRFWGQNIGKDGAILTPTNLFLLLAVFMSVPILGEN